MLQNFFPYRTLIGAMSIASFQFALASPDEFDFLAFAAIERLHSEKQWCEENFPEFKSKNEIIFRKSIYSRMTSEEFIQTYANEELKQKLLPFLPKMRAEMADEYKSRSTSSLQRMCSAFDLHLGQEGMRDARTQPSPAAPK